MKGGELETFLVDKAGHLLAWGSNRYGQLGLGQRGPRSRCWASGFAWSGAVMGAFGSRVKHEMQHCTQMCRRRTLYEG